MHCPSCQSTEISKNGFRDGKQNHRCRSCGRQFVANPHRHRGYSDDVRELCLKMYVNGMGFRAIERVTEIHHTTIIGWVKQADLHLEEMEALEEDSEESEYPEVGEVDELHTFVGSKQNPRWVWTAVNHFQAGILDWTVGDRSARTFKPMWERIKVWDCYFWVSDGWKVYDQFLPDEDRIISKTYMTRVEGENTRLRHYLARLKRKSLCYSKCEEMLKRSIHLLLYYLKQGRVPLPQRHPAFLP